MPHTYDLPADFPRSLRAWAQWSARPAGAFLRIWLRRKDQRGNRPTMRQTSHAHIWLDRLSPRPLCGRQPTAQQRVPFFNDPICPHCLRVLRLRMPHAET